CSTALDCVLSSFQIHNETINIWTHFLPTWYFAWRLAALCSSLDFVMDPYSWPLLVYMLLICVYPFTSSCAHTFSAMSTETYHICFFFDYGALSLYSLGCAISYGHYVMPECWVTVRSSTASSLWLCSTLCSAPACPATPRSDLTTGRRFYPHSQRRLYTHQGMGRGLFGCPGKQGVWLSQDVQVNRGRQAAVDVLDDHPLLGLAVPAALHQPVHLFGTGARSLQLTALCDAFNGLWETQRTIRKKKISPLTCFMSYIIVSAADE
uniref:Progestin and adipoQ receptor family member VI n=1 Tax=Neogobius melanostomus TaxID=47308 RepID=A0A8C6UG67_9GOBI